MISGWIGSLVDGSKVPFPRHEEVKMQGSKSWESTLVVPAILVLVFWLEFCGDLKQTVQIVIYSELKMQEKNRQHVSKLSFRFVVEVSDWHVFAVMSLIASDSFSWGYWLWDWKVITCMTLSAGLNRTTMWRVCFISALIQFDWDWNQIGRLHAHGSRKGGLKCSLRRSHLRWPRPLWTEPTPAMCRCRQLFATLDYDAQSHHTVGCMSKHCTECYTLTCGRPQLLQQ